MIRCFPGDLDAGLVVCGDGKLQKKLLEETRAPPVRLPGFLPDREHLATALASSDIYVSAMADRPSALRLRRAAALAPQQGP